MDEPDVNAINSPKIVGMILAHNCQDMLQRAHDRIPRGVFDHLYVMDDGSTDDTEGEAKRLGMDVYRHSPNRGYGGNVKEGLRRGLEYGADYVCEIHGDGAQFDPGAIRDAMPQLNAGADLVLGSRFQQPMQALRNGMPLSRFVANASLSFIERKVLQVSLTELHTGFRVYSRHLIDTLPTEGSSEDYLFSFEIIAQAVYFGMNVVEVPVEADYRSEHTSVPYLRSVVYAWQTFGVLRKFRRARSGSHCTLFPPLPLQHQAERQ